MKGKEQSSKTPTLSLEMRQKVSRSSFRDALSELAFVPSSKEKAWAMLTWGEEDYGGIRDVTGLISLLTKPSELIHVDMAREGDAFILTLRLKPYGEIAKKLHWISREHALTKLIPKSHLKVKLFITWKDVYEEKTYTSFKEVKRLDLKDMMLVLHEPKDKTYTFSFMGLGEDELYFGDLGLGLNLKI